MQSTMPQRAKLLRKQLNVIKTTFDNAEELKKKKRKIILLVNILIRQDNNHHARKREKDQLILLKEMRIKMGCKQEKLEKHLLLANWKLR